MPNDYSTETIIEPGSWKLFGFRELWQYRELIYYLAWRDVKVKYRQAWIGVGWALAQPLFLVTVFTVFFAGALRLPPTSLPYPVFALSGLLVWNFFSSGLTSSSASMISHAGVIKKVYVPRLVIPISAILTSLFDVVFAFGVFIILLIGYQVPVDWRLVVYAWPLALISSIVGTLGPGLLFAALNVKYKDVRHAMPFATQALFFLTPVIYTVSIFESEWVTRVLSLNPIYASLYFLRLPIDHEVVSLSLVATSLASCSLVFFLGLAYFRRTERFFADLA